jgi:hypothetical protein
MNTDELKRENIEKEVIEHDYPFEVSTGSLLCFLTDEYLDSLQRYESRPGMSQWYLDGYTAALRKVMKHLREGYKK